MKVEIEWQTEEPKETGEYLVTTLDGIVDYDVVCRHRDGHLCWGNFNNVLAWCKISDIKPFDYINSK